MAGTTGLEPATSAVTGQRSNQLSYIPNNKVHSTLLAWPMHIWAQLIAHPDSFDIVSTEELEAKGALGFEAARRNQVSHPQV